MTVRGTGERGVDLAKGEFCRDRNFIETDSTADKTKGRAGSYRATSWEAFRRTRGWVFRFVVELKSRVIEC